MDYWEFLLQKEGDRSWLPLESPDVEILEGRYRVIARSSYLHHDVEVRTIYCPDPHPPESWSGEARRRRVRRRAAKTNGDGLVVVIPFTQLQPGLWEFQCNDFSISSQGASSQAAPSQAAPSQAGLFRADDPSTPVPNTAPTPSVAESPAANASNSPSLAAQTPATPSWQYRVQLQVAPIEAGDWIDLPTAGHPSADHGVVAPDPAIALASMSSTSASPFSAVAKDVPRDPVPPDHVPPDHIVDGTVTADVTTDPTTTDPAITDLATTDPTTTDPAIADPTTADPTTADITKVNETVMVNAAQVNGVITADSVHAELGKATQVEATQVEATQVEATQVEATQVEVSQVEATQVEVSQVEATQVEVSQVEVSQVEVSQVEVSQVEVATAQVEQATAEPTQVEPTQVDAAQAAPAQAAPVQVAPVQADEPAGESDFVPPVERLLQRQGDRLLKIADRLVQTVTQTPSTVPGRDPNPQPGANVAAQPAASWEQTTPEGVIRYGGDRHDPSTAAPWEIGVPPLSLYLDQSTYESVWGQPLLLKGSLDADRSHLGRVLLDPTCELRVILRNPHSQERLVYLRYPLAMVAGPKHDTSARSLPCRFACSLELPVETSTILMLGEIALHTGNTTDAPAIAVQSFSVTADTESILRAVQPDFRPEAHTAMEPVPLPADERSLPFRPAIHNRLDLHFLNLVPGSRGQTAPPPEPTAPEPTAPEPTAPTSQEPPVPATPVPADPTPTLTTLPARPPGLNPTPVITPPTPASPPMGYPAFQALPLGQRFHSRLDALAQDRDLVQWLQLHPHELAPPPPEAIGPEADWVAREIVLDPEPAAPSRSQPANTPTVLPTQTPIPAPHLEILSDRLIPDTPIPVRIRMPEVGSSIYVKLWIQDRQTRQLLEPPRWLTQFRPDGRDRLETLTEIRLPYGVLEVQIDAICVEVATQRESLKAAIERRLDPADWADVPQPVAEALTRSTLF